MADNAKPAYRITEAHIADLRPQPEGVNTRKHNPRNIGMIADSMQDVGAARSVVIDEDNDAMAGSGSIEAFAQAGMEKVLIVETDGETLVAVKRKGLTKAQKLRLALADNRTNETSEWDRDVLAELMMNPDENPFDGLWNENELAMLMLEDREPQDPRDEWDGMPSLEAKASAYRAITVYVPDEHALLEFAKMMRQTITDKTKHLWWPPKNKISD